jgi:hypothetical protein
MANSTRLLGLILVAAFLAAGAGAQELPLPGLDEPASPGDLSLPALDGDTELPIPEASGSARGGVSTGNLDIESLEGGTSGEFQYDQFGHGGHDFWAQHGAPIESTGTWLRRGFWYAEAEAVVWNRHWNRDNKFMAVDDVNVLRTTFFPRSPNFAGQEPIFNTNRLLMLDGAEPGEDASVRFTLGHFLFRDSKNRDHTTEFTALGGGDWHQHRVLSSSDDFGLFVPYYISGAAAVVDPETGAIVDVVGNRTFNASTRQEIDYSSHFSSFEWNYRVEQRPGRDQMIMDANGNWHRAAKKGIATDYLVGLRFMEMRDILDWRAEDIQGLGNDGSYLIRTDNDMFGLQMGAGLTYDTARWSLGYHIKGGVFLNNATGRSTLNFTVDDSSDSNLGFSADELSFIGEGKLIARWHLLPDFSLRASYEMMYLTSQAVAPNQATFITDYSYLNATQDPFYHGASFGFEGYW